MHKTSRFTRFLRGMAATLSSMAGTTLIATLWMRELTELAVIDAVVGGVYLIIGIGLYGKSRFSLFLGIVVPAVSIGIIWSTLQPIDPVYRLRLTVDASIAVFSLFALWRVRNMPSV
ncbi:MAG: hypothetical protein AB8C02_11475 [Halioglobus sp.]